MNKYVEHTSTMTVTSGKIPTTPILSLLLPFQPQERVANHAATRFVESRGVCDQRTKLELACQSSTAHATKTRHLVDRKHQRVLNDLKRTRLYRRRMIWLLVRRPHRRLRKRDYLLTGECGVWEGLEEEPNNTTVRKSGPLQNIQHSLVNTV